MFWRTFPAMEHFKEQHGNYYGENFLKARVSTQLYGWLGNEDFWGGAIGDSDYHADSGYLEEQRKFQESDLVDGRMI